MKVLKSINVFILRCDRPKNGCFVKVERPETRMSDEGSWNIELSIQPLTILYPKSGALYNVVIYIKGKIKRSYILYSYKWNFS